jgi:outer membrane lipopolysaccharide assembly protein LptE/RlpB
MTTLFHPRDTKASEERLSSQRSLRLCGEIIFVFLLVVLCGCGYQLTGKATHLPAGVTSLAIPTFRNQTLEPGIEVPLTQSFLREFMFDGRVKVLSPKEADTILEGIIKAFRIQSVSYNESGFVQEYQVLVTVELTLTKSSGEILWKDDNLTEVRWYRASFGGVINEASKNSAVQELGKFMAERVKSRFFYNF